MPKTMIMSASTITLMRFLTAVFETITCLWPPDLLIHQAVWISKKSNANENRER